MSLAVPVRSSSGVLVAFSSSVLFVLVVSSSDVVLVTSSFSVLLVLVVSSFVVVFSSDVVLVFLLVEEAASESLVGSMSASDFSEDPVLSFSLPDVPLPSKSNCSE